jgi:hypothetical protein
MMKIIIKDSNLQAKDAHRQQVCCPDSAQMSDGAQRTNVDTYHYTHLGPLERQLGLSRVS